jgi:hypothetical protein
MKALALAPLALLVLVSSFAATAWAAPPAGTARVAQADPPAGAQPQAAPPAPSAPSSTEPAPAPVPVTEGSPAAVPVVTVGASGPTADAPAAAASQPTAKPKPRPFAGSSLYNQNSVTTGTLFRGQQQYANSTVESTLFILPRYAINEAFQLRARLVVAYEYTNSDSTTYRNEPLLSDTGLSLFYRKLPKFAGIQPALAANVALPTSKVSRARTLVFTPGATLQLARPFEHFLGGEAMLLANTTYSHPIYQSRNPEVADPRPPGAFACVGGNNCQDLLSGTMNPSDILSYSLIAEAEWGKWSPAVMYLGASQWVYKPTEAINPIDGTPVGSPAGFSPTSVRQTHYVSAWLDYNFNSWFTGEVGFWNAVAGINGGGERSNLLFDRYQDTRVYLGCSVQLDNLVKTVQGGEEGEAGVVRAKNGKQPMWTF